MRRAAALAAMLVLAAVPAGPGHRGAAAAQGAAPLLVVGDGVREERFGVVDLREMDISEAGGYADIFVTLMPAAGARLAAAGFATGARLQVTFCGLALATPPLRDRRSGHLYIANTSVLRAEALRAVWQGRARCDTLAPEVFQDGY